MNLIIGIGVGFAVFVLTYIALTAVCAIIAAVVGGSAEGRVRAYSALSSLAFPAAILTGVGAGIAYAA